MSNDKSNEVDVLELLRRALDSKSWIHFIYMLDHIVFGGVYGDEIIEVAADYAHRHVDESFPLHVERECIGEIDSVILSGPHGTEQSRVFHNIYSVRQCYTHLFKVFPMHKYGSDSFEQYVDGIARLRRRYRKEQGENIFAWTVLTIRWSDTVGIPRVDEEFVKRYCLQNIATLSLWNANASMLNEIIYVFQSLRVFEVNARTVGAYVYNAFPRFMKNLCDNAPNLERVCIQSEKSTHSENGEECIARMVSCMAQSSVTYISILGIQFQYKIADVIFESLLQFEQLLDISIEFYGYFGTYAQRYAQLLLAHPGLIIRVPINGGRPYFYHELDLLKSVGALKPVDLLRVRFL